MKERRDRQAERKLALEAAKLERDLRIPRILEIILDKWMPAIIAGVVLFTAVPAVNWFMWRSQKSAEFQILVLQKKMDTYSAMASEVTRFTQLISLLHINRCPQETAKLGTAEQKSRTWCDDLVIERFALEPRIVKLLRDVRLYFGPTAAAKAEGISDFYNNWKSTLDDKFVEGFRARYRDLSTELRSEIASGLERLK